MRHSLIVLSDGTVNIVSIMIFSMIARRPLAPVLRFNVVSAISNRASLSNSSFTPSSSRSFWYCFTIALFGSVRMRINASLSRRSNDTVTGSLPTSSGIKPNFTRSCGSASWRSTSISYSCFDAISALNPIDFLSILVSMILSIPSKAPPQINKMFVVSIWINSWCGCFLPPCGGTDATVPSMIFRSACCTPSPDTSLVMEVFSDFLVILSISSM